MKDKKLGIGLVALGVLWLVAKFFNMPSIIVPLIFAGIITLPYFMSSKKDMTFFLGAGLFIAGMALHNVSTWLLPTFGGTLFFAIMALIIFAYRYIHYRHYHKALQEPNNRVIKVLMGVAALVFILELMQIGPIAWIVSRAIPLGLIVIGIYLVVNKKQLFSR